MNYVTITVNDYRVSHHLFSDKNLEKLEELLELIDRVNAANKIIGKFNDLKEEINKAGEKK